MTGDIGSAQWWQAQCEAAQAEVNRQEKMIEALREVAVFAEAYLNVGTISARENVTTKIAKIRAAGVLK